jgi:hypothetical protein
MQTWQYEWRQGKTLGSLNGSKQTEQVKCSSNLYRSDSAIVTTAKNTI